MQRQRAVVLPEGVVLPQVHLGVVVGPGGLAVTGDPLHLEADRGGVELQPGVLQRLAHDRRVAVGTLGGLAVLPGLPADEEVPHGLVR